MLDGPHPECFTLGKEPWCPLLRRSGGPQGHSGWTWWIEKLLPLPKIKHWSIQPAASHYTNYN